MADYMESTIQGAPEVPGYRLGARLHDGGSTLVYRAIRDAGSRPVVLKLLRQEALSRENLASLQHEFALLQRLDSDHVVHALTLDRSGAAPCLVLEDCGGEALDRILARNAATLGQSLELAIGITRGLVAIHDAGIIHKDINPSNILHDPASGMVKVMDFNIATTMNRENATLSAPGVVPGTLAYMSPEQTGRMNRALDYRTDLYSLGATLYELLTGRPLFVVTEPIEWFHCHIARTPLAPADISPGVPRVVSDLVMKLLAKTAEDRYQSARGLLSDLQACRDQYRENHDIRPFPLALRDVPERFRIPQKLYGREADVAALMTAFDHAYDKVSLALVAGPSGMGKSSLIRELYRPVTARHGYFIVGKFDLLQRDVPYGGLVQALRDLIQQVLTESAERVALWKARILADVGDNTGLLTGLIPDLELIVGPQPRVPEAPALEAEQRFRLTLFSFMRVFSRADHPLVLVLDDLQWADSSTMRLADLLVDQMEGDRLLVVGAFRDNEITPDHPLIPVLTNIDQTDVVVTRINVGPLGHDHLCQLLADTFRTGTDEVASLARLVVRKTEGNPFFVDAFLEEQHRQGTIAFDASRGRWTWDLERMEQQRITDNVAGLMTHKLQSLAPATRQVLQHAACVGGRFPLALLVELTGDTPARVVEHLRPALDDGMITAVKDRYQLTELVQNGVSDSLTVELVFSHDRIQETAYALVSPGDQARAHLRIGRWLRASAGDSARDEALFAIVNHLNIATALMTDPEERLQLARLNMLAGRRARQAASYPIAFSHFRRAIALAGDNPWRDHYPLALEMYAAAAEAAAAVADHTALDQLVNTGQEQARDLLDSIPFHEILITHCVGRGELERAIALAKPILAALGHHYPAGRPRKLHVILRFLGLKRRLARMTMARLRALPDCDDPRQLAAARIGASIGSAAMFAEPMLLPLMVIRSVEMTLDYGHNPHSVGGYGIVGMMYASSLGDARTGLELGQLSLELSRRFPDAHHQGRALHIFGALVQHWGEPLANTFAPLREASRLCLESGDFEYAIHAANLHGEHLYLQGEDLDRAEQQTAADLATFRALHQGPQLHHLEARLQGIHNLQGLNDNPARLAGASYDIDVMMPRHRATRDGAMIAHIRSKQLLLQYHFRADADARGSIAELQGNSADIDGFYGGSWTLFLSALVCLRFAGQAGGVNRLRWLRKAAWCQRKLNAFARGNPDNFRNKVHLVAAEKLRVQGREFEAHAQFDRSEAWAGQQNFLHEQALANELCGQMHLAAGRQTLGEPYLRRACQLYRRWGALAKVRDIETRFPQLSMDKAPETPGTTRVTPLDSIDLTSLMKALKAIASEQIHSRMVATIIRIALEFAGAQRGILVLRDADGSLCIEAEASVDQDTPKILQSLPLAQSQALSQATVNYVSRTGEGVVIHDALATAGAVPGLHRETYVTDNQVRSVLCLPIKTGSEDQTALMGLLYLENNRASNCFTDDRFGALEIICIAAAGRLELSRKAAVDGLTNLYNHDYFQNMLRQELAGVARYQRDLALILIDIDHFKGFNDTWGHQLGDRVLREVADLIKENSRDGDTAARYGGEEMAVILPATTLADGAIVAERIRKAIAGHRIPVGDETLTITVSLGLAAADAAAPDAAALIRRADTALYQSKDNGRNQVTLA